MWLLMKNKEEEEGQKEEKEREEGRGRGKERRDILRKKKQTELLDSCGNISNNYCISLFLILPSTNNS